MAKERHLFGCDYLLEEEDENKETMDFISNFILYSVPVCEHRFQRSYFIINCCCLKYLYSDLPFVSVYKIVDLDGLFSSKFMVRVRPLPHKILNKVTRFPLNLKRILPNIYSNSKAPNRHHPHHTQHTYHPSYQSTPWHQGKPQGP